MSISLSKTIRTCKVDTSLDANMQSDRFLNSDNMICPRWLNQDITGRQVCADSWYTKSAGCNSAEDRVLVENTVSRPLYSDLISLNMQGVTGDIYGQQDESSIEEEQLANQFSKSRGQYTGNYGIQWRANNVPQCGLNQYENAMASMSQQNREANYANSSYLAQEQRNNSGMY